MAIGRKKIGNNANLQSLHTITRGHSANKICSPANMFICIFPYLSFQCFLYLMAIDSGQLTTQFKRANFKEEKADLFLLPFSTKSTNCHHLSAIKNGQKRHRGMDVMGSGLTLPIKSPNVHPP
jgi:hypothetical protein